MNSFVTDLKATWNKPNSGLARLIIINVIAFVVMSLISLVCRFTGFEGFFNEYIFRNIALPPDISDFIVRPWTLITYFFSHSLQEFFHILFNMLMLYWFGVIFMEFLGSRKLVVLYILGGLVGGLLYLTMYNLVPYFISRQPVGMIGASACAYAIVVGAATLSPDYRMNLLFFGPVKIKYIAAVTIFISLIGTSGANAGGNLAHLGGALIGFVYIKALKAGTDLGKPVSAVLDFFSNIGKPSSSLKVTYRKNSGSKKGKGAKDGEPDQEIVDAILDKISEKGYENLTQEEKQILFKASQKKG
ncbi:rhomboid family intramembrane serine protease [Limibacter armeniacum]|uniref:rhomboid family intramembrane serine protease n=1 Tax=Limibacter armeniacum TaxID=466084 RepID=UPI002FE5CA0D